MEPHFQPHGSPQFRASLPSGQQLSATNALCPQSSLSSVLLSRTRSSLSIGGPEESYQCSEVDVHDPLTGEHLGIAVALEQLSVQTFSHVYKGYFASGPLQGHLTAIKILTTGFSYTSPKAAEVLDRLYKREVTSLTKLRDQQYVVQLLAVGMVTPRFMGRSPLTVGTLWRGSASGPEKPTDGSCRRALLLQWMPGGDARALIDQAMRPMDEVAAGSIILPVARALEACHRAGIVHRDVKAGNILLAPGAGQVCHADWGISVPVQESSCRMSNSGAQLRAPAAVGTEFWCAPEIERGLPHDESSDIFSLAMTFVELITGRDLKYDNSTAGIRLLTLPESGFLPKTMSQEARSWVAPCLSLDPGSRPTIPALLAHSFFVAAAQQVDESTREMNRSSRPSSQLQLVPHLPEPDAYSEGGQGVSHRGRSADQPAVKSKPSKRRSGLFRSCFCPCLPSLSGSDPEDNAKSHQQPDVSNRCTEPSPRVYTPGESGMGLQGSSLAFDMHAAHQAATVFGPGGGLAELGPVPLGRLSTHSANGAGILAHHTRGASHNNLQLDLQEIHGSSFNSGCFSKHSIRRGSTGSNMSLRGSVTPSLRQRVPTVQSFNPYQPPLELFLDPADLAALRCEGGFAHSKELLSKESDPQAATSSAGGEGPASIGTGKQPPLIAALQAQGHMEVVKEVSDDSATTAASEQPPSQKAVQARGCMEAAKELSNGSATAAATSKQPAEDTALHAEQSTDEHRGMVTASTSLTSKADARSDADHASAPMGAGSEAGQTPVSPGSIPGISADLAGHALGVPGSSPRPLNAGLSMDGSRERGPDSAANKNLGTVGDRGQTCCEGLGAASMQASASTGCNEGSNEGHRKAVDPVSAGDSVDPRLKSSKSSSRGKGAEVAVGTVNSNKEAGSASVDEGARLQMSPGLVPSPVTDLLSGGDRQQAMADVEQQQTHHDVQRPPCPANVEQQQQQQQGRLPHHPQQQQQVQADMEQRQQPPPPPPQEQRRQHQQQEQHQQHQPQQQQQQQERLSYHSQYLADALEQQHASPVQNLLSTQQLYQQVQRQPSQPLACVQEEMGEGTEGARALPQAPHHTVNAGQQSQTCALPARHLVTSSGLAADGIPATSSRSSPKDVAARQLATRPLASRRAITANPIVPRSHPPLNSQLTRPVPQHSHSFSSGSNRVRLQSGAMTSSMSHTSVNAASLREELKVHIQEYAAAKGMLIAPRLAMDHRANSLSPSSSSTSLSAPFVAGSTHSTRTSTAASIGSGVGEHGQYGLPSFLHFGLQAGQQAVQQYAQQFVQQQQAGMRAHNNPQLGSSSSRSSLSQRASSGLLGLGGTGIHSCAWSRSTTTNPRITEPGTGSSLSGCTSSVVGRSSPTQFVRSSRSLLRSGMYEAVALTPLAHQKQGQRVQLPDGWGDGLVQIGGSGASSPSSHPRARPLSQGQALPPLSYLPLAHRGPTETDTTKTATLSPGAPATSLRPMGRSPSWERTIGSGNSAMGTGMGVVLEGRSGTPLVDSSGCNAPQRSSSRLGRIYSWGQNTAYAAVAEDDIVAGAVTDLSPDAADKQSAKGTPGTPAAHTAASPTHSPLLSSPGAVPSGLLDGLHHRPRVEDSNSNASQLPSPPAALSPLTKQLLRCQIPEGRSSEERTTHSDSQATPQSPQAPRSLLLAPPPPRQEHSREQQSGVQGPLAGQQQSSQPSSQQQQQHRQDLQQQKARGVSVPASMVQRSTHSTTSNRATSSTGALLHQLQQHNRSGPQVLFEQAQEQVSGKGHKASDVGCVVC